MTTGNQLRVLMSKDEWRAYRYSCKCQRRRRTKRLKALACADVVCAVIIIVRVFVWAMA